jgi:hypothetical protein
MVRSMLVLPPPPTRTTTGPQVLPHRERGEGEASGYASFALHAPIHWAIQEDLIKITRLYREI